MRCACGQGCFGGNLNLTVNGNNQITAPSPITYDAASGNMTKDNRGFSYTYDAENRRFTVEPAAE